MAKFYSASTGGFYASEIHGSDMPDDVVGITDEAWLTLCAGLADGKSISAAPDGRPELAEPPAPTKDELIAQAEDRKNELRAGADYAIQPLEDADELGIATDAEKARLSEWKTYRVKLNRVDTSAAQDIIWPEEPS